MSASHGKPEREPNTLDIAARTQAEEKLRESEARLRSIMDNLQDAYFQADLNGRLTTASPSAMQMFGYRPAEGMIGLEAEALYADPDERASMLTVLRSSGRVNDWVTRAKRKDATTFWISMNVQLRRDKAGQIVGTEGVVRDITQRKEADERLRESEERFRSLSEVALEGVMIHGEGSILNANLAFARIFGYETPEEMIGKYGPEVILTPESREIVLCRMKERITGVTELTGIRKDGSTFLMETESRAVKYMSQDATIVSCRDVTARKQAEEALHKANEQLRNADRRKDEFLAMLAHELRNPLAAISNAIELLKLRGSQDPIVNRAHDAAERQTAHMARLLDDLLDVARVTQGKVTLNREDVSLASILESAIEASNPFINVRKHHLYVSHPREPVRVHGDRVRLAQAIGNLLHNAAKYTPPGGEIYLGVQREGDEALILVRDTGTGIDAELLPQIFELFVQGSRSPDRADGGLGVGLTLVRSIVQLHGGRVEARSEGSGRGSEFRIWLTLLPEIEERLSHTGPEKLNETKSLRILVVDDNVDSAELISFLLQTEGHQVAVANSGPAALDLAIKDTPEVALIDIGMPRMDGYELAKRMRALPELRNMALIALTGYGQPEDIQKSLDTGFNDHLVKPVDMETLRRGLRKIERNMG